MSRSGSQGNRSRIQIVHFQKKALNDNTLDNCSPKLVTPQQTISRQHQPQPSSVVKIASVEHIKNSNVGVTRGVAKLGSKHESAKHGSIETQNSNRPYPRLFHHLMDHPTLGNSSPSKPSGKPLSSHPKTFGASAPKPTKNPPMELKQNKKALPADPPKMAPVKIRQRIKTQTIPALACVPIGQSIRFSPNQISNITSTLPKSSLSELEQVGQRLLAKGQISEARTIFECIIAQQPRSPHALTMLGAIYMVENDEAHALALFQAALDNAPSNAIALIGRGTIRLRWGQIIEAIHDIKKVMATHNSWEDPLAESARALCAVAHAMC